ncbi:MAG: ABC transporter ATP-binding protein [Eubacteriales bacterium]
MKIEVQEVDKRFDHFQALDKLTMTVPQGSIYGLVGPNGAGKSTVIRHILGGYRPDSGTILIGGEPVYENTKIKSKIASIPDDLYYFDSATTRDMMKFYSRIYPQFDHHRYKVLKEAFPDVEEKRQIRRLSKGMQKQSAFWLSLCCVPDVLILDEPVDGLDPVMRRQVWSLLMHDVAQRGTTVLVSSHNLRELEDVCDHVGMLSHGKVLLERSLSDLQDNVSKIQIAFPEMQLPPLPEGLDLLHQSQVGRIHTLILRGDPESLKEKLGVLNPLILDALPLTLEEIFIYELGGEDYAVKEIQL